MGNISYFHYYFNDFFGGCTELFEGFGRFLTVLKGIGIVSKTQLGIASQKLSRTHIQNSAWSTIEIKLTVDKVE